MSYSVTYSEQNPIVISALYKFVTLNNFKALREPLLNIMRDKQVSGTLLLAQEGINGTIAGSRTGINQVIQWLTADPRLTDLETKESYTHQNPFKRTKVKLKKEIVTMGINYIDPNKIVGTYVKPTDWNTLIRDPDVTVIDCRNDYEYNVGTFENAINPKTKTFREFPDYVKQYLNPTKHKKVAMFCTGGIRCEKSTAYLKEQGFDEVYHLQGGILKYLEEVPKEDSSWQGECFVFDDRVTVNHDLEKGLYDQCNACRLPITKADKQSPLYTQGISCPHCYDQTSEKQRQRYAQREYQIQLAKTRGENHIGGEAHQLLSQKRRIKKATLEQLRKQQALKQTQTISND